MQFFSYVLKILLIAFLPLFAYGTGFQVTDSTTIDDIERFLGTLDNPSIEALIENLDPEFRSNFVLMHNSKSIQSATHENPRVIMHSNLGKVLFAFNGHAKQTGGNKIEMIFFDGETKKFNAHEIEFKSGGIYQVNRNPKSCVNCHGSDSNLRPLWNHYNSWPGAYGSNDDELNNSYSKDSVIEFQQLSNFYQTYLTHPRYKYLVNLNDHLNLTSYRTERKSNSILTELIMGLNYERMITLFKSHPDYKKLKYSLITLFSCHQYKDFINSFTDISFKNAIESYVSKEETALPKFYGLEEFQLNRSIDFYMNVLGFDSTLMQTNVNDVLISNNFSYFPENVYYFSAFRGGSSQFIFNNIFASQDSDIKNFVIANDSTRSEVIFEDGLLLLPTTQLNCDLLASRSQQELKDYNFNPIDVKKMNSQINIQKGHRVIVSSCLKCHMDNEYAGFSFQEQDLKEAFKTKQNLINIFKNRLTSNEKAKRMPVAADPLNLKELNFLLDYLRSFIPKK